MSAHPAPAFSRFGDVAVRLSVELGRTEMALRDVLMLGEGSMVALDRLTDELLDVTANGRVIARGEVVADKGRFALRIVNLVGEDGRDVPPLPGSTGGYGERPAPPAEPVAFSSTESAPQQAAPSPAAAPPPAEQPPVDPLTAALDDLL
jgi:flagellar motor switch protein FliN/FliY